MEFHSMKRKQLQALCKKYKIPANLSNLEMAKRLAEFHKEEENPAMPAVVEEQEESVRLIECRDVVLSKKCKKVRFSPEHELIEFTREPVMKRRTRRNSVYRRESSGSLETAESGETENDTEGRWGRTARTGELKLLGSELKQKKRVIKAVKCNDGRKVASAVESFDDEELEEGGVVRSERVNRLRGKMAAEVVKNAGKRGRKSVKSDDKRDEKEHHEEVVNNRCRVTRSRAQKSIEVPAVEEKRVRAVGKNGGKLAALSSSTKSLSKKVDNGEEKSAMGSDELMKGNGKCMNEILVKKQVEGECGTVEPQLRLRRSKREANIVAESEMYTDVRKHGNDEVKRPRKKASKSLASDGSEVDIEISRIDVNPGGEEPVQKMEPRRSNRRKTMIQSGDVNGYPLRSSVPQPDVSEVCKDDKVVMQPMRVMSRSRRNASETVVTVENLDAEKHISELPLLEKENDEAQKNTRSRQHTSKCGPLEKNGEDSNIHQENKVMKQPRGHVSREDDIKSDNDPNSGTRSLKGSSSQKVLSATTTQQSADERKQPHRLGKLDMLDALSHHGSSTIDESLILDVQLSASKDSDSTNNLCIENMISGEELTSITEADTKEEEASIADIADSSCMNSETNAACKRAELDVEKGKYPLEVDVEESIEQNLADADKNEAEALVYNPIEDSCCITKINDQILEEGLDVREANLFETRSSTQSLLTGDTEVADIEVWGCVQPCLRDNNSEDTLQVSGKDDVFESCETMHHGDNVAEENEIFFDNSRASELAEAEDHGCLKHHSTPSDHFSEFNVPDISNGERDARIVSPDRGNVTDECSVMHIAEHCYQAVDPSAICSNSRDVNPRRGYEDNQMTLKEDRCIYEGINSEVSDTREPESSKDQKRKCDEDGDLNLAELFNEEGRYAISPQEREHFACEHSDKDFTELGISHGSPSTEPTTMCNNTGNHEANLSAGVGEAHNFNDKQLEITEAEDSECMKCDKSSNSQETSPSTLSSVSATQAEQQERLSVKSSALAHTDWRQGACSNASELAENAVGFVKSPERNISQVAEATHATSRQSWTETELQKLFGTSDEDEPSGLGDIFHQGSETKNMIMSRNNSIADMSETCCKSKDHTEAELSDAHLQKSGVPHNSHLDCTLDDNILGEASEETSIDLEAAKFTSSEEDATTKGTYLLLSPKASPVHDELIQSTDTDDLDGVKICEEVDAKEKSSQDISDELHTNREVTILQSLSDYDNQFEEARNIIALAEHGSSVVNLLDENTSTKTFDVKKFVYNVRGENNKKDREKAEENSTADAAQFPIQELHFEENSEHFKIDSHAISDLPTPGINEILKESDVATPVKNMTPCKAEETYCHESVVTESMSEMAGKGEYEVGNTLSISAALSDDGGNGICEGINEAKSFELLNTCTRVISGAVHDSCEALQDQLVQNNIISTSGSTHDLNRLESCTDMSETCCKSEDHTKAELSKAVTDNSHLECTLDGNILGEASVETSSDPEVANIVISEAKEHCSSVVNRRDENKSTKTFDVEKSEAEAEAKAHNFNDKQLEITEAEESECMKCDKSLNSQETSLSTLSNVSATQAGQQERLSVKSDALAHPDWRQRAWSNASELAENAMCFVKSPEGKISQVAEATHATSRQSWTETELQKLFGTSDEDAPSGLGDIFHQGSETKNMTMSRNNSTAGMSEAYCKSKDHTEAELSHAHLQKSGVPLNSHLDWTLDGNIYLEAAKFTSSEEDATAKGTYLLLSPKASPVHDELIQSTDTDEYEVGNTLSMSASLSDDGGNGICEGINEAKSFELLNTSTRVISGAVHVSYEALQDQLIQNNIISTSGSTHDLNVLESCTDMSETCCKSEDHTKAELSKAVSDNSHLDCTLDGNILGDASLETSSDPEVAKIARSEAKEHGSSDVNRKDENKSTKTFDVEKSAFNLSGDNDKKDSEKAEENSTAEMCQFSIQELHFEENAEDFKNDTGTISDIPASGINEILKESDVADTIKEYIESESSLSVIFENSSASLSSDTLAHTDETFTCENENGIAGNHNVPPVDGLDADMKVDEEAELSARPVQVSDNTANSSELDDFFDEGSTVKLKSQKKIEFKDGQSSSSQGLRSTMRKNNRTIMILGTPSKLQTMPDKENAPYKKRFDAGDITEARPAKRRALQNIPQR